MMQGKLLGPLVVLWLSTLVVAQISTPSDALALEQQGKLAEAADAWRTVIRKDPNDASALASLGVILSKEHKYREAASTYKKALGLNSKLPGVELNLGLAEFKQGHLEAAIAPLQAASAANPRDQQASTLLGLCYYGAKRFTRAIQYLEPAVKSDPTNVELREVLAQSCLWAKKYSCALDEFHQILRQNPDSAAAHILSGEALDGLGRTGEAIAEFRSAAEVSPRESNVHFGLGYLYWKSHLYDDAQREFESELANDVNHPQALAYLGDIAMKRNDSDEALNLLRRAIATKHDIRIAYLDLGGVLTDQKHYQEAVAALQHAVELDPAQPDAHYKLGRAYRAIGKTEESRREFAKVRQLHEKADEPLASKMSAAPPPLPQ